MVPDFETTKSRDSVWITARFEEKQKSEKYPRGVGFAAIGRVKQKEQWREVIRVDNSPHKGIAKTHIHFGKRVIYTEIASLKDAERYVDDYLKTTFPECYYRDTDTRFS